MANNLFISYDLIKTGQNYDQVIAAIKTLGSWAKIQQSLWYVSSNLTAEQARSKLSACIDGNDKLIVVDAKNNSASWTGLSSEVSSHIKDHWRS